MRHKEHQRVANMYLIVICILLFFSSVLLSDVRWFKVLPAAVALILTGMLLCGLSEVAKADEDEIDEENDDREDYYA